MVDIDPHAYGRVEEVGPGKSVYTPKKYIREDTGTHDTLKIVDESLAISEDQDGFDPYNTGRFDRPDKWRLRARK